MSSVPPPNRVKLPLIASLAALLLLAVLAARGHSGVPRGTGLVLGPPSGPARSASVQPPPRPGGDVPTAIGLGAGTIFLVALVAFLLGLSMVLVLLGSIRWRRRLRLTRRASPGDTVNGDVDGDLTASLLRGARSALLLLRQRTGGPPADAVQEAWLALEAAAAEHGTTRRPEQTSTEFTEDVLAAHAVDPAALTTLRGLYQRARFGQPDTVTEADAEAAIAALDRIAATLTGGRAEAAP